MGSLNDHIVVGQDYWVFDPRLYVDDVKTPLSVTKKPATVLRTYMHKNVGEPDSCLERVFDVRFHYDGRESKAHFLYGARPVRPYVLCNSRKGCKQEAICGAAKVHHSDSCEPCPFDATKDAKCEPIPEIFGLIHEARLYYSGERFMGTPEAWMEDPHYWCPDRHVSARYLKSDLHGCLCLACGKPVWLGPKESPGVEPNRRAHDVPA